MTNNWYGVRFALIGLLLLCVGQAAVAADISGDWVFTFDTPNGVYENTITISTSGEKATAKMKDATLSGTFVDSKLDVSGEMYVDEVGYKAPFKLNVTFDGTGFKGDASWDTHEFPATAKRAE